MAPSEHFSKLPTPSDDLVTMNHAVLDYGTDDKISVDGYKRSGFRYALSWLAIFATGGLLGLVFYWKPEWWLKLTSSPCSLEKATAVIVTTADNDIWVRPVKTEQVNGSSPFNVDAFEICGENGQFKTVHFYRCFTFKKLKYIWVPRSVVPVAVDGEGEGHDLFWRYPGFVPLAPLDKAPTEYYHIQEGLSDKVARRRTAVYGPNHIVVRLRSIPELLLREVLNPFYMFQVFSVCLWYSDEYMWYASCIVLISVVSISIEVYQLRTNQRQLRDMVHSTDVVTVLRRGGSDDTPSGDGWGTGAQGDGAEPVPTQIESTALTPGDVILVPAHGCIMQCDAVLISGNAIVNESMLTGESVPVTKISIGSEPDIHYHPKENAKNTLFCGTKVLQTRFYAGQHVKAVVIRTGFYTFKGDLVRSIMYPKPVDFQFTKDLFKMLGMLGILAMVGFVYAVVIMVLHGAGIGKIIKRSLDIITIVVPPALPAAMTVGIMLARDRMKKRQIYCISPSTINTCGAINCVVFDKTGTLTEDGLDFQCALPVKSENEENHFKLGFGSGIEGKGVQFDNEIADMSYSDPNDVMVQGLASCHSLTIIEGELTGEPLDLILFKATRWVFEEQAIPTDESSKYDQLAPPVVKSPHSNVELGILRQFPFSSNLQRMAVIVRRLADQQLFYFCKGAPEKIAGLCDPATLPVDFSHVLGRYLKRGYRVLALGYKPIEKLSYVKLQKIKREEIENNLVFVALLVMENRLKPETKSAITVLKEAEIRTTMATGDNILTALSVGRECGLVPKGQQIYETEVSPEAITLKLVDSLPEPSGETYSPALSVSVPGSGFSDSLYGGRPYPTYSLAMTGAAYANLMKHHRDKQESIVALTSIFARVAPEQKAHIINDLQRLGYVVAMCGDGANDCGALKAAHAGISLSDSEASIASPFTSKNPNITCVPTVIREGRAALVTSFGVFKYMAAYSMTQFLSVSILYWIASNLSDFQFLFIDLFLITILAMVYGYTPAAGVLVPRPPPSRVLSTPSVLSILLQVLLVAVFQVFIFIYVAQQPWFTPFTDPGEDDSYRSFQVTVVFLISCYQYVALVVVYSKSYPYRKSIINNPFLTASIIILTLISILITIYPPRFLASWLVLEDIPMEFRGLILILSCAYFFLALLLEYWVIDRFLENFMEKRRRHPDPARGGLDPNSPHPYEWFMCNYGQNPDWIHKRSTSSTRLDMEGEL